MQVDPGGIAGAAGQELAHDRFLLKDRQLNSGLGINELDQAILLGVGYDAPGSFYPA